MKPFNEHDLVKKIMYIVVKHIESIEINNKKPEKSFIVLSPSSKGGFLSKKKMFPKRVVHTFNYNWKGEFTEDYTPIDEFGENELYIENDKVFYYPHIVFTLRSGQKHIKYFPNFSELMKFRVKYIEGINNIKL
jgi:hypothetical protein